MAFSKKTFSSNETQNTMQALKHAFKKQAKKSIGDEKADQACCTCFGFFNRVKIPKDYRDVVSWLVSVTTRAGVNQTIIITALKLSSEFVSQNTTGNEAAAEVLAALIQEAADRLGLELDLHADYLALQTYCDENKIKIPGVLQSMLEENLAEKTEFAPDLA